MKTMNWCKVLLPTHHKNYRYIYSIKPELKINCYQYHQYKIEYCDGTDQLVFLPRLTNINKKPES